MNDLFAQLQQYEKNQAQKFPTSGTIAGIDGSFVDVSIGTTILRNVKCVGTPTSTGQAVVLTWENGLPTAHITGGSSSSQSVALVRGPAGPQGEQGPQGPTGAQGPKGDTGSLEAQSPLEFPELSSAPVAPAAGKLSIYAKNDHKFYKMQSDGTEKEVGSTSRELLAANRTYYVRTDGNNNNDGLSNTAGGAFLTIQKAVDVAGSLDLSVYAVTIQVANGTYTAGVTLKSYVGVGPITIQGDTTTPSNVVISITSGYCFLADGVIGKWRIRGFKLSPTSAGVGIGSKNSSIVEVQNIDFGAASLQLYVDNATLLLTGSYTISAGANIHLALYHAAKAIYNVSAITVTLTGTPNFSTAFLHVDRWSGLFFQFAVAFSGSATGKQYNVMLNSVLYAGGSTIPGNAGGTVASGGQYT